MPPFTYTIVDSYKLIKGVVRLEMICDLNFLLTREHVLCFVTFNLKMQEV